MPDGDGTEISLVDAKNDSPTWSSTANRVQKGSALLRGKREGLCERGIDLPPLVVGMRFHGPSLLLAVIGQQSSVIGKDTDDC